MRHTKHNILKIARVALIGLALTGISTGTSTGTSQALAAATDAKITDKKWSFDGPFGTFDKAALQRGFQVYREICAACHGLDYVAFRNLADLGYNAAEIKAIAAEYEVQDEPNDDGEIFARPAIPADRFPNPFANENAARASNGGAYPPDLSLMIKARPNGADYMYSLLTSYQDPPKSQDMPEGMYYNTAYSGHLIAMAPPLYGDDIERTDGGDTSVEALAADVVAFLAWTAEPHMETRKRIGIAVVTFLLIMCFISYASMRYTWANVKK